MKKRTTARIQSIVDEIFPHLVAGEISLETVLAAHPEDADALRPCLESALWLSSQQPALEPRPAYLGKGKHSLVTLLNATQAPTWWQRLWLPHSPQRAVLQTLSLSLLVVSLALVMNTILLASRLALPGDTLYPAKLSIERLQLALTIDPQEQARLQIEMTQHRTSEIVQLVLEDDFTHLPDTARRLEAQIDAALGDLEDAHDDDSIQAQGLAVSMKTMLENETFILTLLRDLQPAFVSSVLDQAIAATNAGLTALQN
jgi:hypothetical protein